MSSAKMTSLERQAVFSLSMVLSLRMLGLFIVLPVFSLYAAELPHATPFLIGLALGVYGLSQALLQIPCGFLSDKIGRKPIILAGLTIFMLGSLLAAFASSIEWLILARALQGVGAIGSTILALIADLTRDTERSKAMAIAGMTIGFSFSLSILLGPLLAKWINVSGLFLTAFTCGALAILILWFVVPDAKILRWHREAEPEFKTLVKLLFQPDLAQLNLGIFILHVVFTASFVVIPIHIYQFFYLKSVDQWVVYLPVLCCAFIATFICIYFAEKTQRTKLFFLLSLLLIIFAEGLLSLLDPSVLLLLIALSWFFTGFSLLEAFLPALISRIAPVTCKGTALGIYSCAQFLGIFIGGLLGGYFYGKFSFSGVYSFCIFLTACWFVLTLFLQLPRYLINEVIPIPAQFNWHDIAKKLQAIAGIKEAVFIAEDNLAYLKMDAKARNNPEYVAIKQLLHANSSEVEQ